MMLYILLLIGLLCSVTRTQFNLYNTDTTLDVGSFHTNCLHHYSHSQLIITEKIEYCLGPTSDNDILLDKFPNTTNGNFTFDELHQLNVTTKELLRWSAAIDLIERYQYYIDQSTNSSTSTEIFFNCTKPWFGPRCQYSFGLGTLYTLQEIVRNSFRKKYFSAPPYAITSLTCYIHLKCDRGGSNMCLDWREICDGRIDCVDGGIDEEQCFQLEINECNENEYRCRNGLCISKELLKDEQSQCLDGSDSLGTIYYPSRDDYPHIFDIEEHACPSSDKQFKCGDGRCVADYGKCLNKRDLFLYESISIQGNLSSICWMTMICLTKILDQVNGTSCQQLFRLFNITTYLQTCETVTQFPSVPILFGHIRFLYILNNTKHFDTNLVLIPDYICYDQQLCDFLIPTFRNGNYTCRHSDDINLDLSRKLTTWPSLISVIEPYFRKCLTTHNNNTDHSQHPSLYCCRNSSKCISKHRILDNISDCYLNDDEEQFELSCLINDTLRFKCGNENKCYPASVSKEICPRWRFFSIDEIDFQHLCDGYIQMLPVTIDGQNYTDESECEKWPCNNIYTRCDHIWNCPSGEDEENCTERQICPSSFLGCVSPYNYTLICLPANQVNDQRIDCLGAADELQYCRSGIWDSRLYPGFHCWNESKCIGSNDLCDKHQDCSFEDDEVFCGDTDEPCWKCETSGCSNVTEALCHIGTLGRTVLSLETLPVYPVPPSKTIRYISQSIIELYSTTKYISSEPYDRTWPWRCNHGLYVSVWSGDNSLKYKCFCPPHYYGDLCQYQNQRVSFTAKVNVINRYGIYAIIVTLIDDDDDHQEINSYHQFISINTRECEQVYNTYLTYLSRPKNTLRWTKFIVHVLFFM